MVKLKIRKWLLKKMLIYIILYQKVQPENKMFMDSVSVKEVLSSLKIKNAEGYDRIPQRVLVDGANYLIKLLTQKPQKD